jgi:2-polyprenyl-3-methyl-5-hydroxy-6-metoxy-1,4-benzoquinol methylase
VSEKSGLMARLRRHVDEVRRLRIELDPSEWKQHERLQELRREVRVMSEQVSKFDEERRALRPEVHEYAEYWRAVGAGDREPDEDLVQRLRAAVRETAPTTADDPRLAGWYHTVDLGNGLCSNGGVDLRSTVDQHGLPETLRGKTALDVGTCNGFWAFELERRGADRVVAVDIEYFGDFDFVPRVRNSLTPRARKNRMDHRFWLAHALRGSRVEHRVCSVYDLSPDTAGMFDVVFCGSLLMHLHNPLGAVINICSVTAGMAVIATLLSEETEAAAPDRPWISFGQRGPDLDPEVNPRNPQLGASAVYWHLNTRALQEIMEYAGFARTEALQPVPLAPLGNSLAVVVGHPERSGQ